MHCAQPHRAPFWSDVPGCSCLRPFHCYSLDLGHFSPSSLSSPSFPVSAQLSRPPDASLPPLLAAPSPPIAVLFLCHPSTPEHLLPSGSILLICSLVYCIPAPKNNSTMRSGTLSVLFPAFPLELK